MARCATCAAELAAEWKFCIMCGTRVVAPEGIPAAIRSDRDAQLPWREPTSTIPPFWGNYRDRYVAGLVLIMGGLLGLQGATTWSLHLLLVGSIAHVLGWLVLPGKVWRRLVVTLPSGLVVWLLLTGPQSIWLLVVPFLGWLFVRQRPPRSYLGAVFVVFYGVVAATIFREYDGMLLALAGGGAVCAGAAWLARFLHRSWRTSSPHTEQTR